jgi:hypothetical protein
MTTPPNGTAHAESDAESRAGTGAESHAGASAGSHAGDSPLPGARLAEELRLLVDALAERAQPLLNRLAADPAAHDSAAHDSSAQDSSAQDAAAHDSSAQDSSAPHTPATCGWCPLCAAMAVFRGERPELAVRAAEHAAGLLSVLRSALAEPAPSAAAHEPAPDRVQHITVRRSGDGGC